MALSSLLGTLPSRGLLTTGAGFTNPPAPYIAQHDTAPSQVLETDTSGFLIRNLDKRTTKAAKKPAAPAPQSQQTRNKRPQPQEATPAAKNSHKRPNTGNNTDNNGTEAGLSTATTSAPAQAANRYPKPHETNYDHATLGQKTNKELQALLKSWSLSTSGRKDEMISRIISRQSISHR